MAAIIIGAEELAANEVSLRYMRGDNAGEHDGASPDAAQPSSNPHIYNVTYIGSGIDGAAKNEHALLMRDGTCGTYANSIFTDFANFALQVEDLESGYDSRECMENGDLVLRGNVWWASGEGSELNAGTNGIIQATSGGDASAQFLIDHLSANCNTLEDPGINISRDTDGGLNPSPATTLTGGLDDYPNDNSFFTPVCFKGAFESDGVWIKGWTAISEYGVLDNSVQGKFEVDAESGCQLCESVSTSETQKNGYLLAQANPNPTTGYSVINFELPSSADITMNVYDINGKPVMTILTEERFSAGAHTVELNLSNMANGVYYYTLQNKDVILTRSLVVTK